MSKRKYSRLFKYILNTATAVSVSTLVLCAFAVESNKYSWLPVCIAVAAFLLLALTEWVKERERN